MKNILTIFKKELKDTLRDRRTLLTMLVLPTLLIPVLSMVMMKVAKSQMDKSSEKALTIAVFDDGNGGDLVDMIERRKDVVLLKDIDPIQFKDLVKQDSIDLGVVIQAGFGDAIRDFNTGTIDVTYNSTDEIPLKRLTKTIDEYSDGVLAIRLDSLGANNATINPVSIKETDAYTDAEGMGKAIGGFLPYIFVLFCLMGGMYPAIDLFTGEKERGTIETILTTPVTRLEILLGKMGTVVLGGVVSGILAIFGMYLALKINADIPDHFKNVILSVLNPKSVSLIILMIIPLTVFFAGLLIPASIYSKSFKEAQSLIQPALIVVILPLAVVASIPSLKLTFITALIPIVNVALACKDVIADTIDYGLLAVVFASLVLFAGLGVALCVRWFGDEGNILR